MNIDQLRKDLEADEGCKYEIYLDHLGYPTFGIGHLITKQDVEFGEPVGTPISEERVKDAFEQDIDIVLEDCDDLFEYFDTCPEEVQLICANMCFNLGYPRLSRFENFRDAVDNEDWQKAADEMVDSRWYRQVTNRAERLVQRMRAVE